MRTASAFSILPETGPAIGEAADSLLAKLGRRPDIVFIYATEHHAGPALTAGLAAALGDQRMIGGTTCGGVMTEAGFHAGEAGAVGLFGLCDPDGAFGVGFAPIGDDAHAAGVAATAAALADAGRDFESPSLVWCCQPPGSEERVLSGIEEVVGAKTPVIGGSSADEAIAGAWRQFATGRILDDHVAVAALFPSSPHGAAFQSGYAPTEHVGAVTKAHDRQVLEIDHRPAAEIYSAWTEGGVDAAAEGPILAKSTPTPLGRIAAEVSGVPMFVLSHPSMVGAGGDLSLFTDIQVGDRVHLMRGSPDSLVKRAGVVMADAVKLGGWGPGKSAGGLVIYCGGCMLHVRDRMEEVAAEVRLNLPDAPFLGAFTFGEQGAIVDACNRHGNLMVSALAFG